MKTALSNQNVSQVESISKKYSLNLAKDKKLNIFNILEEVKSFSLKNFNKFKNEKTTEVFTDVENITIMSSIEAYTDKVDVKKKDTAITQQQRDYANTLIKELKDKSTVTISNRI